MKRRNRLLGLGLCLPLVSCATLEQHQGAVIGCGVGTLVGAVVGKQLNGKKGRNIGAAVGAGIGCTLGIQWDQRRKALQEAAARHQMEIRFEAVQTSNTQAAQQAAQAATPPAVTDENANGLLATLNTALFAENSDQLSPASRAALQDIARQYQDSTQQILIVGHTDSTGDATANMGLSERRARTVAELFHQAGLPLDRLFYQGAGEAQPVASNLTLDGRAQNRRVEILEIDSEESLLVHSLARKTSLANLRYSVKQPVVTTAPAKPTKTTASKKKPAKTTASKKASSTKSPSRTPAAQTPARPSSPSVATDSPSSASPSNFIDFGGYPLSQLNSNPLLGQLKPKKDSNFSILSAAYANAETLPAGRCIQDEPRISGDVRSLKDGSTHRYKTSDFLPGLYRVPWYNQVNGHLVSLSPVSVLRSEAQVADFPILKIFRNYHPGQNTADLSLMTQVNTYDAQDNLLYRVFVRQSDQLDCIDLLLPKAAPFQAQAGYLFYRDPDNQPKVADFKPRLVQ